MRWDKSLLRFPVLQKENRATAPDKGRSRRSPRCSAPTESTSNPGFKDGKNGNEPPNGGDAEPRETTRIPRPASPPFGGSAMDYGTFIPGFPPVTLGYVCDARFAGSRQQTMRTFSICSALRPGPLASRSAAWPASTASPSSMPTLSGVFEIFRRQRTLEDS